MLSTGFPTCFLPRVIRRHSRKADRLVAPAQQRIGWCVLLLLASSAHLSSQVWQFDVDASDAPASATQTGYTRTTAPAITGNSTNGAFSPTATLNGVTLTATVAGGFRDRGIGNLLTNEPMAALLRDFIFTDGAGATINVTISNLPAGSYDVRSFHFDNLNLGALDAFELLVQDADGSRTLTNLLWSISGSRFSVRSDGTTAVLITVIEIVRMIGRASMGWRSAGARSSWKPWRRPRLPAITWPAI